MKTILIVLVLFQSILIFSQSTPRVVSNDNAVWLGYYNAIKFNAKWSLNSDIQFRTKNELKNNSQALLRTGIAFKINDKLEVTLGVAHFRYFMTDEKTRGEWRPWQELKISDQLGKLKLTHRFRVEQRFNELVKDNEPANEYQFNWRFRYRFDLRFPIIKEQENGHKLFALFGNEVMINAGNEITYNYFDQNRLYAGLNYEINNKLNLQLQYMHVWQQQSNGFTLLDLNVLRFNIYHTISL